MGMKIVTAATSRMMYRQTQRSVLVNEAMVKRMAGKILLVKFVFGNEQGTRLKRRLSAW
jgi:hypothetical protein